MALKFRFVETKLVWSVKPKAAMPVALNNKVNNLNKKTKQIKNGQTFIRFQCYLLLNEGSLKNGQDKMLKNIQFCRTPVDEKF